MALAPARHIPGTIPWRARLALWARALPFASREHSPAPLAGAAADTSFEAFFRRHERDIFGYLWRMTGDEQTANDLTQETFVRAWRHYALIAGYDAPGAWLLRVATNLALNHRRAQAAPVEPLGDADADARFARSDPALRLVEDDSVRRALTALPARQRAALILRAAYGLSCEEVGRALGVSRDAAKMLIFRGRDEFRRLYEREGDVR